MGRKVLVTGGNGFVGREVVRLLYDEHAVCVVDNLRSGPLRFPTDEQGKFHFEPVDIVDSTAVNRVAASFQPDTIIHLAAIHYIPECEENPGLATRINVDGTLNLLMAAPSGCRFVFASSGAVYKPDTAAHNEAAAAVGPSDIYGFNKLHGEHYLTYLAAQRGLQGAIVRLFNVVGPGETNPHLLPEIVAQLKAGRDILRLGNMWPKRDYIHVRDAARGFVAVALRNDAATSGGTATVNLGTSKTFSVAEIVEKLQAIVPTPFTVEEEMSRRRAVDRPHLEADIAEIRRRFGWTPQLDIDQALADLWREPDFCPALEGKYT